MFDAEIAKLENNLAFLISSADDFKDKVGEQEGDKAVSGSKESKKTQ